MKITFYSIIMAVFSSGALIGIIYKVRKKACFSKRFGYICIVLMYLLCILRVFMPIDFESTIGIPMRGVYSDFMDVLCFQTYEIGRHEFVIVQVLLLVWALTAGWQIVRFILDYRRAGRILAMLPERKDTQCKRLMQSVYEKTGKVHRVTVLYGEGIHMPMGMGIRDWKIFLPEREYTDEDLYYILLHEYTHFLNWDLCVKIVVHIFCCIFWWNPLVYFIREDLDKSLEMKCDLSITEKLTGIETADYLQTIVKSIKAASGKKKFSGVHHAVSLGDGKSCEITERFCVVAENKKNEEQNKKSILLWLAVFGIVWTVSYSVLLLPSYEAPIEEIEDVPGAVAITPENSYVLFEDGKYYLILEVPEEIFRDEISESEVKLFEEAGLEVRGINDEKEESSIFSRIFEFASGIFWWNCKA